MSGPKGAKIKDQRIHNIWSDYELLFLTSLNWPAPTEQTFKVSPVIYLYTVILHWTSMITPDVVVRELVIQLQSLCTSCNLPPSIPPSRGTIVKARDKLYHPECFMCDDCGINLKQRGYFFIEDNLYCETHAKARVQPPEGYDVVAVYPNSKVELVWECKWSRPYCNEPGKPKSEGYLVSWSTFIRSSRAGMVILDQFSLFGRVMRDLGFSDPRLVFLHWLINEASRA